MNNSRYEAQLGESVEHDRFQTELNIYVDNEVIANYSDAGEPEDNSFYRDYYWVVTELNKAYELGFKHGIEHSNATNKQNT